MLVDDLSVDDTRTPSTARFDALVDQVADSTRQVAALSAAVRELVSSPHNTHTVIHRTEGIGAWGSAAVTACLFTFLALIALMVWLVPIIHDHDAYIHLHSSQLSKLMEQKK